MAVTKIRRFSSWVLIACTIITLVVLGLFFFGGDNELYKGEMWNPIYVDLLLQWQYVLFGLTVAATIVFAIWQFISNFKVNPKGGMTGLIILVLFAGLMYVTYAIGSDVPVPVLSSEAQAYNTPFWLKITDMWLYTTYTLTFLVIVAIFVGSLKRVFNK